MRFWHPHRRVFVSLCPSWTYRGILNPCQGTSTIAIHRRLSEIQGTVSPQVCLVASALCKTEAMKEGVKSIQRWIRKHAAKFFFFEARQYENAKYGYGGTPASFHEDVISMRKKYLLCSKLSSDCLPLAMMGGQLQAAAAIGLCLSLYASE